MNAILRLIFLSVLLATAPLAFAQSVPWETSYPNEGLAYQGCMQAAAGAAGGGTCNKSGPGYSCVSNSGWSCSHSMAGMSGSSYHSFTVACSAMPPLGAGWFSLNGGSAICKDGCSYGGGGSSGGTTVTIHSGTPGAFSIKEGPGGNSPDGGVCDSGTGPSQITSPFCKTQGGLTQCVTQDGKHCAQASTGKLFCWSPNETGTKVSGNEGATKSPQGKPNNPPPIPPPNNGNWEVTGSGTTSITNNNGDTTNYTTNNYTSSNGTQGDGGGTTNPDGSENPGDGEGDDDGPGAPGSGVGDLYDGNGDKTVGSVFNNFRGRVGASPIVSAVDSFFTVNVGGACPVFTVPASDYWDSMTLDQHCSGGIAQSLSYIGWVLLAGAAIGAAIWALS